MSEDNEKHPSKLIEPTRKKLKSFFEQNSHAELVAHRVGEKNEFCVIRKPWNDKSLGFLAPDIDKPDQPYIDALNGVILPERIAAIYHTKDRLLEVPWTAQKLTKAQSQIVGRLFILQFGSVEHTCSYAESSKELQLIAKKAVLYKAYTSNYRGLSSFSGLAKSTDPSEAGDYDKPISFFVDRVTWTEAKVVELCRYLNFYLKYFDNLSPEILIYDLDEETSSVSKQRYVDGEFPDRIVGRELNATLMSFWSAATRETDATRRFIYFYRIIEYVSFYYLDEQLKGSVRRALSSPNGPSKTSEIGNRLIELIRDSKTDDYGRFKSTVTDLVEARHIERTVKLNKGYFSSEQKFDGGFTLKPILPSSDADSIGAYGMDTFVNILRDVRNALSHGRDQKTGQVILPTQRNFTKILPWVSLIESAAAEVILYEGVS